MRLQYTLTPDDLHEATAPLKPNGRPNRPALVAVAWAYFVLLPDLLLLLWPRYDAGRTVNLSALVAPGASIAVLVIVLSATGQRIKNRSAKAAPANGGGLSPGRARLLGLVFLAPLGLVVAGLAPALAIVGHPSDLATALVSLLPWQACVLAIIPIWIVRQQRRGKRAWAASPWLRRPRTVDVTEDGLRVADGEVDVHYRWSALHRYLERPTLFLIYNEKKEYVAVPRRAFPSAEAEQAFRGLLLTHIGHGTLMTRSTAFPVAVLPVPAESE